MYQVVKRDGKVVDSYQTAIYVRRGLEPALARTVAEQLTAHDGLGSHLRDELGFNEHSRAKPVQEALASAAAFTCGALPPVLLAWLWQKPGLATAIVACTLVLLAVLGYVAERVAGGRGLFGAGRVVLWGALAMVATALIGSACGVSVRGVARPGVCWPACCRCCWRAAPPTAGSTTSH